MQKQPSRDPRVRPVLRYRERPRATTGRTDDILLGIGIKENSKIQTGRQEERNQGRRGKTRWNNTNPIPVFLFSCIPVESHLISSYSKKCPMQLTTPDSLFWCPPLNSWVRVLEERTLFGKQVARVMLEGGSSVHTVPRDILQDEIGRAHV